MVALLFILLLGLVITTLVWGVPEYEEYQQLRRGVAHLTIRVQDLEKSQRTSHADLLDGLWLRAQGEVDQQIEAARRRPKQS